VTLARDNKTWFGDGVDDLIAYFDAEPAEYETHQVVTARCTDCSGLVFGLEMDESATCVRRTCVQCKQTAYMLDSEDQWPAADEEEASYVAECPCGAGQFETAVGFSFYDNTPDSDVRWVSVAARCTADGLIGYYADWKIGYGLSHHLVDKV
jgi:hypothetical protein